MALQSFNLFCVANHFVKFMTMTILSTCYVHTMLTKCLTALLCSTKLIHKHKQLIVIYCFDYVQSYFVINP